ncbi:Protein FAM124A [Triplophysa tibetana]|uniref:Protein FAM124A n=1 Tax=Triplophysa tibetana TaxID=1572043 RepID=A0A5A9MTP9_9TELE|nr:Protein FAM124A [Triplophysa tibetana]
MEDETADSGAETAGSDCSKMSCSSNNLMTVPDQEALPVTMHLLTNPGDSLMLQHTLDRLIKWVCPGLRLFHVSERACPLRDRARANPCTLAGHPSHAVTLFLHESHGEKRIRRVLEFLQCPPWQYHHTENCGVGDVSAIPSPSMSPCLLPSRDFYRLGVGMPVWGVRTVHYGDEVVRVTLHSTFDNFVDTVRLYEMVLQRRAEEQKTGFCWFTLFTERGFSLQLAIKQLSPGVECPAQPQRFLTSAFPLSCPTLPSRAPLLRNSVSTRPPLTTPGSKLSHLKERAVGACSLPPDNSPRGLRLAACGASESPCSSPPGSSCYSSQRSSPAGLSVHQFEPAVASETSVSSPLLEEPETDVDTGYAVNPLPERTLRASGLETLAVDLKYSLPEPQCTLTAQESSEMRRASQCHSARTHAQEDEFFI